MIKLITGSILTIAIWLAMAPRESWYWICYNAFKKLLKVHPDATAQLKFNRLPKSKTYHIPRVIETLAIVILSMLVMGFWLGLFANMVGMCLYEFWNTEIMHGSWKFWKSWTWDFGGISIPYARFPAWCMILMTNFFMMFAYIAGDLIPGKGFAIFYIATNCMYYVAGIFDAIFHKQNDEK